MANVINMSKNQKINMTKDDGTAIKNFFIGVNWDQNRYAGEADIDFDINGFCNFGAFFGYYGCYASEFFPENE